MSTVAHWLSMPLKIIIIRFLRVWNIFWEMRRYEKVEVPRKFPDMERLMEEYKWLSLELDKNLAVMEDARLLVLRNWKTDHQLLRTASLLWAWPDQRVLDGIKYMINVAIASNKEVVIIVFRIISSPRIQSISVP